MTTHSNSIENLHSHHMSNPAYPNVPNADAFLIHRPQLEQTIYRCLEYRLLLMIAPPGFGKTTSLMQVFSSIKDPIVWHTVEMGEVDARKAATNISRSIEQSLNQVATTLPHATPLGYASTISHLISRHTKGRIFLVFDSMDRSEHPEALTQLIQCLLDRCPARVHFVIASTYRPRLRLSRLARSGTLGRITKEDLIFTYEDVELLLALRWGQEAARRFAREVFRLTGGCAANVILLLMAWQMPPSPDASFFSPNHDTISLFEPTRILGRLDPVERQILLTISLLPKFDQPLISELCRHDSLSEHIDSLLGSVPITKVSRDGWLSLAPALSDSLCALAEVEWTSEKIAGVKARAARIFELRGELDLAIELFLAAGSITGASNVLDGIGISDLAKRDSVVLVSWSEKLKPEEDFGPAAHYVSATGHRLKGNFDCAIKHYNAILAHRGGEVSESDLVNFLSLLHRLQVSLGNSGAEETRATLFSLSGDSPLTESHLRIARGLILSSEGALDEAFTELKESLRINTRCDFIHCNRATLYWIGLLEMKRGNYRAAFLSLQESVGSTNDEEALAKLLWQQTVGCLHWLQGESELARARYLDGLETARNADIKLAEFHLLFSLAATDLEVGDIEEASELIETAEFLGVQLDTGPYTAAILAYHKACLVWELGEKNESIRLMREFLNSRLNEPYFEAWWRLCRVLLLFRSGSTAEAVSICRRVYDDARDMGARHLLANASLLLCHISSHLGEKRETESYRNQFHNLVVQGRYRYMPSTDPELIEWANAELAQMDDRWQLIRGPKRKTIESRVPAEEYSIRIQTLGRFGIVKDGRPLDPHIWHSRTKSKLLFQILLSRTSKMCSKDEIIEYLWPDADTEKGTRGTHATVWALRKILKDTKLSDFLQIEFEYGDYRLVASPDVFFDHETFRSLISRAQTLINKDDVPQARRLLLEAVKLYQGDFIHDTLYERFADTARTQFFDLQSYCLTTLARFSEDIEQALDWWRQTIGHDPYSEEAYQGHIETCVDNGLTREALDSMAKLKKHIVQELDLPMPDWASEIESRLSVVRSES